MRAGILTRFSTDKQRDTSCDDQIRVCRSRADRDNWSIVATYRDEGISGSTPVNRRPDGARMLADAFACRFDILLMEGLDRLSRDMVEQERIVRRLEHHGIRIIGVSDGYDSTSSSRKLHRGMRGIINEVYLDDLRTKTHRGLAGQFDRGLFAGGMSYGYQSIETQGGYRLEVDEKEAKWVRWIFEQYADGKSPRHIAHELNKQGVPSPRGGTWAVSALYGSPRKGTGILNNELYVGRYIWNRSRWVKDPDTGKRQRIERPRQEWKIAERDELRIVPDSTWLAARERLDRKPMQDGSKGKGKRPSTLLGGLLRCGICDGAVVAVSATSYGCAAHHDRGSTVCAGLYVNRNITEARVLSAIRDEILSPASISAIQQELHDLQTRYRADATNDHSDKKSRLGILEREIRNLTDAVAVAGLSQALHAKLAEAEAERDRVRKALAAKPADVDRVPNVLARYKQLLMNFPGALNRRLDQARDALREMLGEIPLTKEGNQIYAEIRLSAERLLIAAGGDIYTCGSGGRI